MATKTIFISHSSKDTQFAQKLTTDLSYYGIKSWLDDAELSLGDPLTKRIRETIGDIDFLAVVFSSHSVNSEWVKKELKFAQENGKIVVPILLDKVTIPDDMQDDIRDRVYADFTSRSTYARTFQKFLKLLGHQPNFKASLNIFVGLLALGWENASWDCDCDEESTRYVYNDTSSIRAGLQGFGGLAFAFRSGVSTEGYKKLEFYINGGDIGGQRLKVYVNDRAGNGVRKPVTLETLLSKQWRFISVSLKDLDAEDMIIVKINISNISGEKAPDFYLNDLNLVA